MAQQMRADAEMLGVTNSSTSIRVHEYRSQDSVVFVVYSRNRCWKRFRPINGAGPARWFEHGTSGDRSLVSNRRKKWLERIRKRHDSYPRVRRFPRNDENVNSG